MCGVARNPFRFRIQLAVAVALLACGRATEDTRPSGDAPQQQPQNEGGARNECGPSAEPCGSGAPPLIETSDTSDCSERAALECDAATFADELQSLSVPSLEACSMAVPHDGCGKLLFDFDAEGCLSAMTTPIALERGISDHFAELRGCLKPLLDGVRFECLSNVRVALAESCFIR